ncbi:MAG: hypothetical protein LBH34_05095 [Prevotellaceae bacterium]|jgi:hypothetical protein|nr:hypothetical protein [Prevotellaceae bacterium]
MSPKGLKILLLILLGGTFYSAKLVALDTVFYHWQSFQYIKHTDAWLISENAAGLQYLPILKISLVEVSLNKDNGEFINYYQSNNSYSIGARAESFFRLSPKVVLYGKVGYSNFHGRSMGGSAFIEPGYNIIDIVEMADSTRGSKVLEDYHLIGAIGINIYKGLSLGGKVDYRAMNYAKYKDLRHTNKLLDMSVTAGFSYKFSKVLDFGVSYFYRRTVEGLLFEKHGNIDKQYNSMVNFGAFYGRNELFSEHGYTSENNPSFNRFNGLSVQVELGFTNRLRFFNEFSYKLRNGHYGQKTTSTPIFLVNNASVISYKGVLLLEAFQNNHSFEFKFSNEQA